MKTRPKTQHTAGALETHQGHQSRAASSFPPSKQNSDTSLTSVRGCARQTQRRATKTNPEQVQNPRCSSAPWSFPLTFLGSLQRLGSVLVASGCLGFLPLLRELSEANKNNEVRFFCHDSCKCLREVGAHRDIFQSCSSLRCGILKALPARSVVHVVDLNSESKFVAQPN